MKQAGTGGTRDRGSGDRGSRDREGSRDRGGSRRDTCQGSLCGVSEVCGKAAGLEWK